MLKLISISTALVLAGTILACGGGEPSPAELTPGPPTTDLHLIARNLKFDKKAMAVPANSEVSLTFANQDSGTLHNVGIYRDKSAKEKVFVSELITGKKTEVYSFRTPAAGQYYFRCDAHTDMNGMLFVE
jgi:plastocyanin